MKKKNLGRTCLPDGLVVKFDGWGGILVKCHCKSVVCRWVGINRWVTRSFESFHSLQSVQFVWNYKTNHLPPYYILQTNDQIRKGSVDFTGQHGNWNSSQKVTDDVHLYPITGNIFSFQSYKDEEKRPVEWYLIATRHESFVPYIRWWAPYRQSRRFLNSFNVDNRKKKDWTLRETNLECPPCWLDLRHTAFTVTHTWPDGTMRPLMPTWDSNSRLSCHNNHDRKKKDPIKIFQFPKKECFHSICDIAHEMYRKQKRRG